MKKILLVILLSLTISFANENKTVYLDEIKMDYSNIRPFVGLDVGYAFVQTSGDLDSTIYPYSVYMGLPISNYDIILKHKTSNKDDFRLVSNILVVNIPMGGSGADLTYFGLLGGQGKLTWKDNKFASLNLLKKSIDKSFYGVHIGKRYKFSRNFYVRIELEYMKYDYVAKTNLTDVSLDSSLEFIYGFEYRF